MKYGKLDFKSAKACIFGRQRKYCDFLLKADSTLSRLNVLREKIEATEALISIHLDSRRNDLVAFDLVSSFLFLRSEENLFLLSSSVGFYPSIEARKCCKCAKC